VASSRHLAAIVSKTMRFWKQFLASGVLVAAVGSLTVLVRAMPVAAEELPAWAYGTQAEPEGAKKPAPAARPAPDHSLKHLPGTTRAFTSSAIGDPFGPADWFPEDHPRMPEIVAHGRKPEIWACSLCHYPNGRGRPENAGVSGLPVEYFIEQMHSFRDGRRKSADPRKRNTNIMIAIAKAMTEEEIKASAEYFGAIQWAPWIKVEERPTVIETHTSVGMFLPVPNGRMQPIGHRLIEMPVQPDATEKIRDPRSGFIAYAPPGSIRKGRDLATKTGKKTEPCGVCHGPGLKGLGPVPGIAGRSPSYMARQLYDMKAGTRNGSWNELMKPVVQNLSNDDILNIVAYVSSLAP